VYLSSGNRYRPHFRNAFSTSSWALRFADGSSIGSPASGMITTSTVFAFNTKSGRYAFSFFFALAIPAQIATGDTATTVVPAAIPRILSRHRFFHHGLRPVLAPLSWKSCSNLYLSRDSQRASLEFGTCRTRGRSGAICVDDRQQANALAVECQHQSERSVLVAQEALILRQMLGLTGKISSSCLNSRAILGLWNRFFMASPIVDS